MPPTIKWAEITIGKITKRYTMGVDTDEMGFIGPGLFAVATKDGKVMSYAGCPIVLEQEDVPDIEIEKPKIVTLAS